MGLPGDGKGGAEIGEMERERREGMKQDKVSARPSQREKGAMLWEAWQGKGLWMSPGALVESLGAMGGGKR